MYCLEYVFSRVVFISFAANIKMTVEYFPIQKCYMTVSFIRAKLQYRFVSLKCLTLNCSILNQDVFVSNY